MIALWGKIALEPLDQDSIKILAEGKSPKKGLLIDYVGNFARSAKEGMPIYRIIGGAGFLWAASFDQAGRGTLRFAAVDASGLSSPLLAQAPNFVPSTPESENATEVIQIRSDLTDSTGAVSRLDKGEAKPRARLDTGNADQETEPKKGTERDSLDTLLLAQYEAQKASLDAKSPVWKLATIGLIFLFIIAAVQRFTKSRKAAKGSDQASEAATVPAATQAHSTEESEKRRNKAEQELRRRRDG